METKQKTISHIHMAFSVAIACNWDRKHAQTATNLERTAHLGFSSEVVTSRQDMC